MSQEVIEFGNGDQKRIAVVQTLITHAGSAPAIKVKLSDLGPVDKVKAPASAQGYPRVCVYEFDKKYYVLLGHEKLVELLQKNEGSLNVEIDARLLTKHTIKRAEPSQVNIKQQLEQNAPIRFHSGRSDRSSESYGGQFRRRD